MLASDRIPSWSPPSWSPPSWSPPSVMLCGQRRGADLWRRLPADGAPPSSSAAVGDCAAKEEDGANNNRGVVNSDDLTAVFVVLCRGSVPHKLRFLFEVFGTRGADGLTRRQFWKYTRALLTGLVHLSSDGASASDARATPVGVCITVR